MKKILVHLESLITLILGWKVLIVCCQNATTAPAPTLSPSARLAFELTKSCYLDPSKYRFDLFNTTKCAVSYTLICWPELEAGKTITFPCPSLFFLPDKNVTRQCYNNGTWESISIHSKCNPLPKSVAEANFLLLLAYYNITLPPVAAKPINQHLNRQIKIFVVMQWISLSIMIPSLLLLFIFPDLNDDKINLHRCLVFSFLMSVVTFLPEYYMALSRVNPKACNSLWIVNRFFAVSEVTWMFNEGLYLLKTIIFVFSQNSYMWAFFLFGWGFPAVLTLIIWTPVMAEKVGKIDSRCWTHEAQNNLMLILYVPMTIMLAVNLIILIYVIGVVILKLKQNHSADLQSKRKAAKGAIILMPLLGFIYLMIFYAPQGVVWYDYLLVVAQPMQGILVCIVHVFFNKDVHSAIKNKWRKFKGNTGVFQSSKFYSGGGATAAFKAGNKTSTQLTKRGSTLTEQSRFKLGRKRSSQVAPSFNNNVCLQDSATPKTLIKQSKAFTIDENVIPKTVYESEKVHWEASESSTKSETQGFQEKKYSNDSSEWVD